MKLVRFAHRAVIAYGILDGGEITRLEGDILTGQTKEHEKHALAEVKLLAPVAPPNVVCIGLNYKQHAEESGAQFPSAPVIFAKTTNTVIGPGADVVLPKIAPFEVDYEAELAIVIGKTMKNVSEENALDYALGYTCANDVSARDCQLRQDVQWTRGKSFDTFCPVGPCIETEMDPDEAGISMRLNGQTMQQSNTSGMIFSCRQLLSYISRCMTLLPGTVVLTGTPSGVGFARKPPVFLSPGDVLEVEIEKIGVLRNTVKAEG